MNLIIQIKGLIFNLYLVFLIVSMKSNSNLHVATMGTSTSSFSALLNRSQDHNKLRFLSKIVLILLLLYIIFDKQLLTGKNFEISLMDGCLRLNKLNITLEIFI